MIQDPYDVVGCLFFPVNVIGSRRSKAKQMLQKNDWCVSQRGQQVNIFAGRQERLLSTVERASYRGSAVSVVMIRMIVANGQSLQWMHLSEYPQRRLALRVLVS